MSWRQEFPFFSSISNSLIYLDSAASTQKPEVVLKKMDAFAKQHYANIYRGVHSLTEDATKAYEEARAAVAKFIGAKSPETIVFTSGTTQSVNLAAYTLTRSLLKKGDTIIATALEHHSNYLPWLRAAEELETKLVTIPVLDSGDLDLQKLEEALKKGAKLLAITHASNVLGIVTPLKKIIDLAHKYGTLVFVDGAQSVAHIPVDVEELSVDFYAFSGHKLYGPTGVGVLYIKQAIIEKLPPFLLGGGMVHKVGDTYSETTWAPAPHRFEAGTPPIVEAIGLHAAIDFVSSIGFEKIVEHERELTSYALKRLQEIPSIKFFGTSENNFVNDENNVKRIGVISLNIGELHPHDVGSILSTQGVAVRVGHHCAQPLMKQIGIVGCVRASIGLYNNKNDIDRLIDGLKLAVKKLS